MLWIAPGCGSGLRTLPVDPVCSAPRFAPGCAGNGLEPGTLGNGRDAVEALVYRLDASDGRRLGSESSIGGDGLWDGTTGLPPGELPYKLIIPLLLEDTRLLIARGEGDGDKPSALLFTASADSKS